MYCVPLPSNYHATCTLLHPAQSQFVSLIMPELPEVESYRQILLSLVTDRSSQNESVRLEFGPPPLPNKRFPSEQTIAEINEGNFNIINVLRKGKVLCVVLEKIKDPNTSKIDVTAAITLHMGMTGRISSPNHIPKLESLSEECSYPPPHTHLIIYSPNGQQACFSDPRKFGSVYVHIYENGQRNIDEECIPAFQELAPDALTALSKDSDLTNIILNKFTNQRKVIKALLLDQRAIISGVGNWVADEVLYRSKIHPDQSFLTTPEAKKLVSEIQYVVSTAVKCLNNKDEFPVQWLFHRRWRGSGKGKKNPKDSDGNSITFVKSGGRSSAIVPSMQRKVSRKAVIADSDTTESKNNKRKKSAMVCPTSGKRRKR